MMKVATILGLFKIDVRTDIAKFLNIRINKFLTQLLFGK